MKLKRFFSFLLFAADNHGVHRLRRRRRHFRSRRRNPQLYGSVGHDHLVHMGRRQGYFHRPQPWERIRARPVPKFRHHTFFGTL